MSTERVHDICSTTEWDMQFWEHGLPTDELHSLRKFYADRKILNTNEHIISDVLEQLQENFLNSYAGQIDDKVIKAFFKNLDPNSILLLKEMDYHRAVSQLFTDVSPQDISNSSYDAASRLIFINDPYCKDLDPAEYKKYMSAAITSSVTNRFLDLRGRKDKKMSEYDALQNELLLYKDNPLQSPRNQIRASMTKTLTATFLTPDDYAFYFSNETQVSGEGDARIEQVGWKNILVGTFSN